jgi:hypothetical protein
MHSVSRGSLVELISCLSSRAPKDCRIFLGLYPTPSYLNDRGIRLSKDRRIYFALYTYCLPSLAREHFQIPRPNIVIVALCVRTQIGFNTLFGLFLGSRVTSSFPFFLFAILIVFSTFQSHFAQIPGCTYASNSCHSSACFLPIFCSVEWILLGEIRNETLPQSKYQRYSYSLDSAISMR